MALILKMTEEIILGGNMLLEKEEEESHKMGSVNHSLAQSQLTALISHDKRFRTLVELSLDASQIDLSQFGFKAKDELIPDICIYHKENASRPMEKGRDLMKMSQMPSLVIEILSPKQTINEIITKFDAFFALGVKSCWLVVPATESITVYSAPNDFMTFGTEATEIIDTIMDIHLSRENIFEW
jgi:Uma2 family endonuclease